MVGLILNANAPVMGSKLGWSSEMADMNKGINTAYKPAPRWFLAVKETVRHFRKQPPDYWLDGGNQMW
jgi:hypothetical protein